MAKAGDGYRFHITGLTHDERGYPDMTWQAQETHVRRLVDKIRKNADKLVHVETDEMDRADIVVVSYGITSRVAVPAIQKARDLGHRVGHLRLIIAWPFPEKLIREVAETVKAFIVPEINYGQMVLEVERCASGRAATVLVPHGGGWVHDPEVIYKAIEEAAG
jgi:2-oxoglutarate ferredoxin oxidoreductase subunit alpha